MPTAKNDLRIGLLESPAQAEHRAQGHDQCVYPHFFHLTLVAQRHQYN